jgi:hypothetical protein
MIGQVNPSALLRYVNTAKACAACLCQIGISDGNETVVKPYRGHRRTHEERFYGHRASCHAIEFSHRCSADYGRRFQHNSACLNSPDEPFRFEVFGFQ